MKIERNFIEEFTLEQFADRHNLILVIKERLDPKLPRFYCYFKDTEILNNGCLISGFGDGNTEEEAIHEYTKFLIESIGKYLILNAYNQVYRREIRIPRIKMNG